MPHKPKTYDGAARPDETPETFAELKPPGYWNGRYFVEVRPAPKDEFIAPPNDTEGFDARMYSLPDRMALLDNMDVNTKAPLPCMQLWEVEGEPVVIEAPDGDSRVFYEGKWHPMDPWECLSGKPMSYRMFAERWPGLVSAQEYLASFSVSGRE